MKRFSVLVLTVALSLMTTHRLPAPISEVPESPTPAAEQSAKPKPKRTVRPKASENSESSAKRQPPSPQPQSRPSPNQTPFAGTWVGKTGCGLFGNVEFTLTANAAGSAVTESSTFGLFGPYSATWDGKTLRWQAHGIGENSWTLRPNADGQTAEVIVNGVLVSNPAPTYRKQQK